MEILPNWSVPFIRDGSGEDRRVFDALKRTRSVGWTTRPSVYYRLNPGRVISKSLDEMFKHRNIKLSTPQSDMDNHFTRQRKLAGIYLTEHKLTKLNIGAGAQVRPGWLNTDLVPADAAVFPMNAAVPFPFDDETFDYVSSAHMIEHIVLGDGVRMLIECFRVLKPGGRIRIATLDLGRLLTLYLPDLNDIQKKYLDWTVQEFMPEIHGTHPTLALNSRYHNSGHKFIYDEQVLGNVIKNAGFENLLKYHSGVSDDPELKGFEIHEKVIDGHDLNDYETLVIEGQKPK